MPHSVNPWGQSATVAPMTYCDSSALLPPAPLLPAVATPAPLVAAPLALPPLVPPDMALAPPAVIPAQVPPFAPVPAAPPRSFRGAGSELQAKASAIAAAPNETLPATMRKLCRDLRSWIRTEGR